MSLFFCTDTHNRNYSEGKLALLREGLALARSKGKENNGAIANERSKAILPMEKAAHDESAMERFMAASPNDFTASDFPPSKKHSLPSSPKHHRTPVELGQQDEDAESVVEIDLIECEECGRSFAPKIFEKHWNGGQPRCLAAAKRTVFNSAKARISNNSALNADEREGVLAANKKAAKELKRKKKKGGSSKKQDGKWKAESQQFREAMKTNRLISKAESEGKPAHYYL